MRNRADEILVSTCIYDSVSKVPFYGYVAVKGDSIFEIGKGDVPEKYKNGEIKITNYGNGTICAGFGDTHTFFTGFIIDHLGIDLSAAEDLEELRAVLENELLGKRNDKALFGNHLKEKLALQEATENMLSELSSQIPIVLFVPGHGSCAMNQKARNQFGFTPDTCYAEALYKMMGIYLNDRDFVDKELEAYMHMLNTHGITSVKEMGFDNFYGFTDVLRDFEKKGKLSLRISFMSQPVGEEINISYGKKMRECFQSEFLQFAGYNQMTDGLIINRQGHLKEPYEGTDVICEKKIDYKRLEEDVLEADRNEFRFTLHSEGDGAFCEILNILEKCQKENGILKNRHGITDIELAEEEDIKRMAQLSAFGEIYAQVYCLDTYKGWVDAYREVIGERQKRYLNFRKLADYGIRLCGATDLPMMIPDIPEAVYYGCGNYSCEGSDRINPENALTVSEMLDVWTINSQYAMERENILGTLEAGKRADIVIFDNDLFQVPVERIREVKVQRTLVNGREVYSREER